MTNHFGLTDSDCDRIRSVLSAFPEIERALVFGSRAMGNHKRGSDVDLAIDGKGVTRQTVLRLKSRLNEEGPLPYFFDVLDPKALDNRNLKTHIDQFGSVIYSRD